MTVATFTQPNYLTQSASAYKAAIDAAIAVLNSIGGDFAPHASTAPNMQVVIDAGRIFKPGGSIISVAQQTTGALIAPITNPRIDRVVVDSEDGVYSVLTGTESASPVAPAIPNGKLPVCQISMTVGMTTIANSIITDERTTYGPLAKLLRMPVEQVNATTSGFTREVLLVDRGILFDCDCSNGPIELLLPDSAQAGNGFMVGLIKTDSTTNSVTLTPSTTGETFNDGALTKQVSAQNGAAVLTTDGLGQWYLAFDSSRTYNNVTLTGTVQILPSGGGTNNIGIGTEALDSITTGSNNIAIGAKAGSAISSGATNVAVGTQALELVTTGQANTAIGHLALSSVVTAGNLTAIGERALRNAVSAGTSVAVGAGALTSEVSGSENVAVGYNALVLSNGASSNTAIGAHSLDSLTTGVRNVAVGANTLSAITITSNNVAIGYLAGGALNGASAAQNVFIGSFAGNVNGNLLNCTFVGNDAGTTLTGGNFNVTCIGSNAEPSSGTVNDEFTLGDSSVTTLRCAVTTITAISDLRDKKDIRDLDLGLNFIEALQPRRFVWNMRDGGRVGEADTGFIAQELLAAQSIGRIPGLVYESNPERLEASPGKLIPVLVKAIQELSKQNDELRNRVEALENLK